MARVTRSAHHASPRLRGAFTALVTPFTADGAVDEAAYRRLVAWQVMAGIDGLVPVGTTGESPTLSAAERDRLIEIAVTTVAERPSRTRIPVIAGTGSNDTRASIEATRRACRPGRRRRADRHAVLQQARPAHARGALPRDRGRGRPADRRLQRARPDRRQRRGGHVPAPGRAPARRGGQGGQRQHRAARGDLPRPAARRGRPVGRRRRDARHPRHGRRRRDLGGVQPDPRRDERAGPRLARW